MRKNTWNDKGNQQIILKNEMDKWGKCREKEKYISKIRG